MTNNLILIGSGGHAGVVMQAIGDPLRVFGIVDETEIVGSVKLGRTIIQMPKNPKDYVFHVAIGSIPVRERLTSQVPMGCLVWIPHGQSIVFPTAHIGRGVFVAAGAVIGHNATIGIGCIINTKASIDHDCTVGPFCNINPGVTMGGGVHVGAFTTIGIGACVRDHIRIGDNCIIGMGSVVTKNLPDNVVAYGNPARVIRKCG